MSTVAVGGPPQPEAVVQCAGCGVVAARPTPAGWVVEQPTDGKTRTCLTGICAGCLATRFTFPADDLTSDTVVLHQ